MTTGLHSAQITEQLRKLNNSEQIQQKKQEVFEKTRYFIAQKSATADYSDTKPGYYNGKKVIPGPNANPEVSDVLNVRDVREAENIYFIRFVDNETTEGADDSIRQALFVPMTNAEADDYEKKLIEYHKQRRPRKLGAINEGVSE